MKKLLILSAIVPSIFVIGCGSGGGDSTPKKQTVEAALKLGDVIYNAPQDIDFNNKTRLTLKRSTKIYSKVYSQLEKETLSCGISGTYDAVQDSDGLISIIYNECVEYNQNTGLNEYYHGTISMSSDGENFRLYGYSEIPDYNNFGTGTYYKDVKIYMHSEKGIDELKVDGTIEEYSNGYVGETMTYTNLVMKNNSKEKSWYFKGGFYDKVENSCFTENHIYDTDNNDWLIESSTNDDYWSSGTLYVDSMRYVYSGDSVTVTKGDISTTFKQQELIDGLKEERSSTDCNI